MSLRTVALGFAVFGVGVVGNRADRHRDAAVRGHPAPADDGGQAGRPRRDGSPDGDVGIVLSERERRTLDEIERRLAVEDPALAQSFLTGQPLAGRSARWPYTAAVVLTMALLAITLLLALLVAALSSASLVAAAIILRRVRCGPRRRRDPP